MQIMPPGVIKRPPTMIIQAQAKTLVTLIEILSKSDRFTIRSADRKLGVQS